MHISLTAELEKIVKSKVETGMYNNASEVIREALRFMEQHDELVRQMKLERLRDKLAVGAAQAKRGEFADQSVSEIMEEIKSEQTTR